MPVSNYPFDDTGVAPSNLVRGEVHTLSATSDPIYRVIIPTYAPFYTHNLTVRHHNSNGTVDTLVENQDYILVLQYLAATRSLGQPVYGGILIVNSYLTGTFSIDYQTIGGEWIANPASVLQSLAENGYNPRQAAWDQITNVQSIFPPELHSQPVQDVTNYQDLINAIAGLANTIASKNPEVGELRTHILDNTNPHNVTKEQVGLGNLVNYPLATDQEVADHLELDRYVTLRQVVQMLLRKYEIITPSEVHRGEEYVVVVETLNIPDGYTLFWTIEHLTTTPYDFDRQSGSLEIQIGRGEFIIRPQGVNIGRPVQFRIAIRIDGPLGAVVVKSDPVNLLDKLDTASPPGTGINQEYTELDPFSSLYCGTVIALGYAIRDPSIPGDIGYYTSDNLTTDGSSTPDNPDNTNNNPPVSDNPMVDGTEFNRIDYALTPCIEMLSYGRFTSHGTLTDFVEDITNTPVSINAEGILMDSLMYDCITILTGYATGDNFFEAVVADT